MTDYDLKEIYINKVMNIPIFANISKDMLPEIIDLIEINEYQEGEYIFKENEEARIVYFIIEGSVQVLKNNLICSSHICLGELESPEFFGEMALLDQGKRSATVIATSRLVTAELSYEKCHKVFSVKPDIAIYVYKNLARELSLRLRAINSKYACNCKKSSSWA